MALAFWRDKSAANDKRKQATRVRADAGEDGNAATALRVRARRRLIGAAALLLAAVIIVPLVLDPAPRPAADNIPIDIPSEKQPFTPRISLPPVPDPGQTPLAPPPDLGPDADKPAARGDAPAKAEPKAEVGSKSEAPKNETAKPVRPAPETKPAPKESAPAKSAEPKARPATESKAVEPKAADSAARAKAGKLLLQAAALSTDAAAQDLSERLRKAGFAPFTEKVETADGVRYRVRVGPYTTRDEAQRAQSKLRALGVSATLVSA
jgi:DedD protein